MTIKQMSQRSGLSYSIIQSRLIAILESITIKIQLDIKQKIKLKRNEDYSVIFYEIIKKKNNFKQINKKLVYIGERNDKNNK